MCSWLPRLSSLGASRVPRNWAVGAGCSVRLDEADRSGVGADCRGLSSGRVFLAGTQRGAEPDLGSAPVVQS